MSLEQAISDHAAALRELAAAIITRGTSLMGGDLKVTGAAAVVGKPEEKKSDAKTLPGATGKSGAKPQTTGKADAAPGLDYEAIKTRILAIAKLQDEGRAKCAALLQRFGVAKGPDLKPEQYEEFAQRADNVLSGDYDPRDAENVDDDEMA